MGTMSVTKNNKIKSSDSISNLKLKGQLAWILIELADLTYSNEFQ